MFRTYTVTAENPITGDRERFVRIFRKATAETLAERLRETGYIDVEIYV